MASTLSDLPKLMTTKKKTDVKYFALVALIITFLSMQWLLPSHTHLAKNHSHDDSAHQHQPHTHAHSLTPSVFAINDSHQLNHAEVITFDSTCPLKKHEKSKHQLNLIDNPFWGCMASSISVHVNLADVTFTKLSDFNLSNASPRAPPKIA